MIPMLAPLVSAVDTAFAYRNDNCAETVFDHIIRPNIASNALVIFAVV